MATRPQIDRTYNYMDAVFRATLGDNPDITCAFYDGDFSKTLEDAQRDKHDYILDGLGLSSGMRFLDVGCGWGPLLRAAVRRGGRAVGLTLSSKQAEACRGSGLEVHVRDWKDVTRETFGGFDAVASVGAFEHFCSEEEYLAGEQEAIYGRFFALVADLLPARGRLFLQTMIWGENMPAHPTISLAAEKGSDAYIVAVLRKFYPGTFPPLGEAQIRAAAAPYFTCESCNDGRLDYIETMKQWGRVWRPTARKLFAMARTVPYALADPDFGYKLESMRGGYNRLCFERKVLGHRRILFEKK